MNTVQISDAQVAFVYSYGRIRSDGSSVTNESSSLGDYAVRPAMWIKIK